MKILIDTNIILDHLLNREPFNKAARKIFAETEQGKLTSFLGATTITTVHYLLTKALAPKQSLLAIESLLRLFEIAPITRTVLSSAVSLNFEDFEDAVLHEAAVHAGLDILISRDRKGFRHAKIKVFSPDEFLQLIH